MKLAYHLHTSYKYFWYLLLSRGQLETCFPSWVFTMSRHSAHWGFALRATDGAGLGGWMEGTRNLTVTTSFWLDSFGCECNWVCGRKSSSLSTSRAFGPSKAWSALKWCECGWWHWHVWCFNLFFCIVVLDFMCYCCFLSNFHALQSEIYLVAT